MAQHDMVIRGGLVIDGSGEPGFRADIAIDRGTISAIGVIARECREEIDATGLIVTPGFVDCAPSRDRSLAARALAAGETIASLVCDAPLNDEGRAWTIAELTSRPAHAMRLADRGRTAIGLRADLNLIDYARLKLHATRTIHDLPADGRRLCQPADGYVATHVARIITYRNGEPSGALQGRLVRGGAYNSLAMAA